MHSGKALFLSQGDDSLPPRETTRETPREGHFRQNIEPNCLNSPNPKKKRGRFAGRTVGAMEDDEVESSVFNFCSQDSNMGNSNLSQFSQDFSDRLGNLTMKASQDQYSNGNSNIAASDDSALSTDCFAIASVPINNNSNLGASSRATGSSSVRSLLSLTNPTLSLIPSHAYQNNIGATITGAAPASTAQNLNQRTIETERKITIGPAIDNPFLSSSSKPPQGKALDLFIAPFKDRPRTIVDFEHICEIGEGVSSVVSCVRRRLDGSLYAVKRIKMKINSISEGKMYIREACAHAVLAGCPYITRYFSCWIDGGHLHIQNEYCEFGSIESFVSGSSSDISGERGDRTVVMAHGSGSQMWDSGGEESLLSFPTRPRSDLEGFSQTTDSAENSHGMPASLDDHGSAMPAPASVSVMKESHLVGVSDDIAWLVLHQVGSAIAYMHDRTMVHLDIRPANVFIKTCCNTDDLVASALADGIAATGASSSSTSGASSSAPTSVFSAALGLSKAPVGRSGAGSGMMPSLSHTHNSHMHSIFSLKPTTEQLSEWLRTGRCELRLGDLGHTCKADERVVAEGEPRYCARELLNNSEGDLDLYSADVFSLGASLYELCLGRELGRGPDGVMEWHSIRDGILDERALENRDPWLVELLRRMIHSDPAQRPQAEEVVTAAANALTALTQSPSLTLTAASNQPSSSPASSSSSTAAALTTGATANMSPAMSSTGVGAGAGAAHTRPPLQTVNSTSSEPSPMRTHGAPTHELAVMASELARLKRENESLKNQLRAVSGLHTTGDDTGDDGENLPGGHHHKRLHATDSTARLMDFSDA